MKYIKEYDIPDWIYDELKNEVIRVFKGNAIVPVKGKTTVEVVSAKNLASDVFDESDGFWNDKDYDKKTELDIFPLYMVDGYEAAYEIDLNKKTVKRVPIKYEDDNNFNLKFLNKKLKSDKKYLIFSVYSDYGHITYIDKL